MELPSSSYLGEVVVGALAKEVKGAGSDTTGLTRQKIPEEREMTRVLLLTCALELHPNQEARPVWSWPERDNHSAAWLLCLPSLETSFSVAEFREAMAALLCLPSPALNRW